MGGSYSYDPRPFYYYDPRPFYCYDPRPFYCYDPRPFYSPAEYKLISLDELYNPSREEPKLEGEKKQGKAKDGEKKENAEKPKTQTVVIKVRLCCDNCVNKVEDKVRDMEGVESVDCCRYTGSVTVRGDVKPDHVLKRVRRVKRDAELWPKKKQT